MIVPIAPEYKFVCDRCGKEIFPNDGSHIDTEKTREIAVSISSLIEDRLPMPKRIQVCRECRDDFETFWDNFRDVVNKEGKTWPTSKSSKQTTQIVLEDTTRAARFDVRAITATRTGTLAIRGSSRPSPAASAGSGRSSNKEVRL